MAWKKNSLQATRTRITCRPMKLSTTTEESHGAKESIRGNDSEDGISIHRV